VVVKFATCIETCNFQVTALKATSLQVSRESEDSRETRERQVHQEETDNPEIQDSWD
jgi:hypothetical protein